MPEWDEKPGWEEKEVDLEPAEGLERRSSAWMVWAGLVALLGFAAGFYFFFWNRGSAPEPPVGDIIERATSTVPALAEESPPPKDAIALPGLDESDTLVKELVAQLSSHPQLASWLVGKDLIRRFVVVVDNIAEGVSPAKHIAFARPKAEFRVKDERTTYYLDPASYERYNGAADLFASVDARGAAALYRKLKPLIDEAYREMGYPDRPFDVTLGRAMDRLLSTPVVEGPVELYPRAVTYEYADPALEKLSAAQKLFLRMGPRNVTRVQRKLRELQAALGVGRR